MRNYLTDREVALALGKHPRTIQRWCAKNELLGATKAGRSWRIPRRALREAKLGEAMAKDDAERALGVATLVCEELRQEIPALRTPGGPAGSPPTKRYWRRVANELRKLDQALEGLPKDPNDVPDGLSSWP